MFRRCVQIVAVCSIGFAACSGNGSGGGNPSGPTPPTPTVTRVIGLSGNLAFGSLEVFRTATSTLTITNTGNSTLTVTGITLPAGFTVNFLSGTIAAGGSQNVTVTFAPTAVGIQGGTLTVSGDQTSGTNTIAVSGAGAPPANRAPVITGITINPAFGIAQLSPFSMSASATDPEGDALSYTWDFGDGTQGTGSSGTKTYTNGGNMTVRLTVSDGRAAQGIKTATTSDTRSIVVGSMAGTWRLTLNTPECGSKNTLLLTLTQNFATVEGTFSAPNGFCNVPVGTTGRTDPAEPGRILINGHLDLRLKIGIFIDSYFRGDMQSTGTTLVGGMYNSGFNGNSTTLQKM